MTIGTLVQALNSMPKDFDDFSYVPHHVCMYSESPHIIGEIVEQYNRHLLSKVDGVSFLDKGVSTQHFDNNFVSKEIDGLFTFENYPYILEAKRTLHYRNLGDILGQVNEQVEHMGGILGKNPRALVAYTRVRGSKVERNLRGRLQVNMRACHIPVTEGQMTKKVREARQYMKKNGIREIAKKPRIYYDLD